MLRRECSVQVLSLSVCNVSFLQMLEGDVDFEGWMPLAAEMQGGKLTGRPVSGVAPLGPFMYSCTQC